MKFATCNCPVGMKYHALNCPTQPGQPQNLPQWLKKERAGTRMKPLIQPISLKALGFAAKGMEREAIKIERFVKRLRAVIEGRA